MPAGVNFDPANKDETIEILDRVLFAAVLPRICWGWRRFSEQHATLYRTLA